MDPIVEHKLLALLSVDFADRVQCGQPGCGHGVYRRIHVVQAGDKLQVLGSTCFSRLYGSAAALGPARFGSGRGKHLTPEERQLLVENTALLMARLEAEEHAHALKSVPAQQPALKPVARQPAPAPRWATVPGLPSGKASPWSWMKPLSSLAYFKLRDGTGWVRVQRTDGQQLLVPWPVFDGWDEALPAHIGSVDLGLGGYVLNDVVDAVKYLRSLSEWEKVGGIWREIAAEASKQAPGP